MQWSVASGTSKRTGRRSTTNFGRCRCALPSKCSVSMRTPRRRSHKRPRVTESCGQLRHFRLECNVSRSKSWNVAGGGQWQKREVNSGLLHGRSGVLVARQIPRGISVGTGPWWRDRQDRVANGGGGAAGRVGGEYERAAYFVWDGRLGWARRATRAGVRRAVLW